MNAGDLRDIFEYNSWANEKILGALADITEPDYLADMKSSHGGLHGTMLHIIFAQHLWLLRWSGKPVDPAFAASRDSTSLHALRRHWKQVGDDTRAFLDGNLTDTLPGESFELKNSKGETYSHTYGDSMKHLINHSTYHRGQIAALMRQKGIPPPPTDYIRFARSRG